MATIRFYTRSKVEKLATVWLRFIDGKDIDIRIKTPYKIYPSYWNEDSQKLKQRILFTEGITEEQANEVEDNLNQLKKHILRERNNLKAPVTKYWLQSVIDKFCNIGTPGNDNLNQYIKRFIEEAKSGKRLANVGN